MTGAAFPLRGVWETGLSILFSGFPKNVALTLDLNVPLLLAAQTAGSSNERKKYKRVWSVAPYPFVIEKTRGVA